MKIRTLLFVVLVLVVALPVLAEKPAPPACNTLTAQVTKDGDQLTFSFYSGDTTPPYFYSGPGIGTLVPEWCAKSHSRPLSDVEDFFFTTPEKLPIVAKGDRCQWTLTKLPEEDGLRGTLDIKGAPKK